MKRLLDAGGKKRPRPQNFEDAIREIVDGDAPQEERKEPVAVPMFVGKVDPAPVPGGPTHIPPIVPDMSEPLEERMAYMRLDEDDQKRYAANDTLTLKIQPVEGDDIDLVIPMDIEQLDKRQKYVALKNWQFRKKDPFLFDVMRILKQMDQVSVVSLHWTEHMSKTGSLLKYVDNKSGNKYFQPFDKSNSSEKIKSYIYSDNANLQKITGSVAGQLSIWTMQTLLLLTGGPGDSSPATCYNFFKTTSQSIFAHLNQPGLEPMFGTKYTPDDGHRMFYEFIYVSLVAQANLARLVKGQKKNGTPLADETLLENLLTESIEAELDYAATLKGLKGLLDGFKTLIAESTLENEVKEETGKALERFQTIHLDTLGRYTASLKEKVELQRKLTTMGRELDKARRLQGTSADKSGEKDVEKLSATAAKIQRETILTLAIAEKLQKMKIFGFLRLVAGYLVKRTPQSLMLVNLEDILFQRAMLRAEINSDDDIFFRSHIPGMLGKVKEDVRKVVEEEANLYGDIFILDKDDPAEAGTRLMVADVYSARERSWNYIKAVIAASKTPQGSRKVARDQLKDMNFLFHPPEVLDAFAYLVAANYTQMAETQKMKATTKSDKLDISTYLYTARERMRYVLRFTLELGVSDTDAADFVATRSFF